MPYIVTARWPDGYFEASRNETVQSFSTFDLADTAKELISNKGLDGKQKVFPLYARVTLFLKDYSHLYCPFCLEQLPIKGDHWEKCDEYEANCAMPVYFPLTKDQALKKIIINNDREIKQSTLRIKALRKINKRHQAELDNTKELS